MNFLFWKFADKISEAAINRSIHQSDGFSVKVFYFEIREEAEEKHVDPERT